MKCRFVTLDVFTDRRFAGNPLAVVLEADGLDDAAMQAIAREFNLSETVFVLPPREAGHRARYRIFTPREEVAFAGHPTLGTAVLLGLIDGGPPARDMVLEANIGPVPCHVEAGGGGGQATFVLPALPAEAGAPPSVPALAAALGLDAGDVGFGPFVPSCFSVGIGFAFTPLRNLDAVRRARPDPAASRPRSPRRRIGRCSSSALRPPIPPMISMPACSRSLTAFRKILRPALRRRPSPACWRGLAGSKMAGIRSRSSRATRWAVPA
jgi:PhzF family phenazine biosynthesis protein